ncbi:polymer-forming cytoskeletal protein [Daejeonella sp.]|uniref:bactofilin family protein n=1 Tax=Daejeonella sp. TaxID=2805397 RepID=UPI002726083A|nr:polymer-forming cytoskeletal protein [Daejeonella sp.]MDO8994878.1 polymer-forming cytoskeletal protein [Daejeonella sp.]MDP2414715.1 polymer-forming cytoskeletal protein [Daejeonella sp.]
MAGSKNGQSNPAPTLISKGCVVHGRIESDVFVRIDGHIKGDLIIGEGLIIGENGIIEGNIKAREIVVFGTVNGSVTADSIDIKSSGNILGELHTNSLQVETGATYIGNVIMDKVQLKKESTAILK